MWWKIFLLSFYLFILFILSRIIEALSYYQSGYLTSHLIDPFTLSVQKLKAILDNRGVSYANVIEKQELSELVESSGELSHGEATIDLDSGSLLESGDLIEAATINFSCGAHFLEKVEDTKDSVWLVQVLHSDEGSGSKKKRIKKSQWKPLVKHLSRFGIQAGTFRCSLDPEFCYKKGWTKDEIILAMPEGYCSKDRVTMKSYQGSSLEPRAIFNWINLVLSSRVQKVTSVSKLEKSWLHFNEAHYNNSYKKTNSFDNCWENVRVLLLSSLKIPPMFFSVMSAKFSGRVKFGIIDKRSDSWLEMLDLISNKTKIDIKPADNGFQDTKSWNGSSNNISQFKFRTSYLIITPEQVRRFGSKCGEYYYYKSLFSFLQSMHPETNDVFIISLIMTSAACCFDLVFLSHLSLYRVVMGVFWSLFKWNLILIFCWMTVLGLFCSFHQANSILNFLLTCIRIVSSSDFFNQMRSDWLYYLHTRNGWLIPFATLIIFYLVLVIAHRKQLIPFHSNVSHSNYHTSSFWNMGFWEAQISSLLQPLFAASNEGRNENSEFNDEQSSDYGMMEMFIERLAMPDLWLRPIISSQYLHDLPVWRHTGCRMNSGMSNESDCSEEAEDICMSSSTNVESEFSANEQSLGSQPYIFICEKCRATLHPSKRNASPQSKANEARDRQSSLRINSMQAAKYLMDGNYKCMCRHVDQVSEDGESMDDDGSDGSHFQDERMRDHRYQHSDMLLDKKWTESDYQNGNVPKGIIMSSECSICLDSYKRRDVLCGLPCGHAYHQNCIMNWLTRDNHCCPVCRWPAYKAKPCHKHTFSD